MKALTQREVRGPHDHEVVEVVGVDPAAVLFIHLAPGEHDLVIQDGHLRALTCHNGGKGVELVQKKGEPVGRVLACLGEEGQPG